MLPGLRSPSIPLRGPSYIRLLCTNLGWLAFDELDITISVRLPPPPPSLTTYPKHHATVSQELPPDGQRTKRNSTSSPYAISHGTTFNVGQGPASNGGGAGAMQSTAFPFSSSTAAAHWAHMRGNEQKLQKMARQSLLHELWQEQQRTHEKAVDW